MSSNSIDSDNDMDVEIEKHDSSNLDNIYLKDKEKRELAEKIRKENNYDINKGILRGMENQLKWLDEIKKCRFI